MPAELSTSDYLAIALAFTTAAVALISSLFAWRKLNDLQSDYWAHVRKSEKTIYSKDGYYVTSECLEKGSVRQEPIIEALTDSDLKKKVEHLEKKVNLLLSNQDVAYQTAPRRWAVQVRRELGPGINVWETSTIWPTEDKARSAAYEAEKEGTPMDVRVIRRRIDNE